MSDNSGLITRKDIEEKFAGLKEEADEIETAVEDLNRKLNDSNQIAVAFGVDDSSGRIVVQIKDASSGELLRQVPSEESLQFSHNVQKGVGLFVDSKL